MGKSRLAVLAVGIRTLIFAAIVFGAAKVTAQTTPPTNDDTYSSLSYTPLASWSFHDYTNWTSDQGFAPVSFTNLDFSALGNFHSLVLSSTNPAWLHCNILETNGGTNLTVDSGTLMFWFGPSWAGTNLGGEGPGVSGRLFEVGNTNSGSGWWSLYLDPTGTKLSFSASSNNSCTTYLTAPIAWTTNYFHLITLTYSPSNTVLYQDGNILTNGPGMDNYPGSDVLAGGFFLGSDSNGVNQAQGLFNNLSTYNIPMDQGTIQTTYFLDSITYLMNPNNTAMFTLTSADSTPSFTPDTFSAISGAGDLQWVSTASGVTSTNVWITNVTVVAYGSNSMNVTFTISGGLDGLAYDVFATSYLQAPLTNSIWIWLGQGYHCNTYTVNVPSQNAFLQLGTPQDTDLDGLTDAYERLVSRTDPQHAESNDAYGVPYAWYLANGLDPKSALQDPDWDALLNYQEYLFGTKPRVTEGTTVWSSGGDASIP